MIPNPRIPSVVVACLTLVACGKSEQVGNGSPSAVASVSHAVLAEPVEPLRPAPRGLPPLPASLSAARVEIGSRLFFDPRLSSNGTMTCATCHQPDHGWAGSVPLPVRDADLRTATPSLDAGGGSDAGPGGTAGVRESLEVPSLYNVGYRGRWLRDGSASSLEKVVLAEWKRFNDEPSAVPGKLAAVPWYRDRLTGEWKAQPVAPQDLAQALADFVTTITSADSPWDRFEAGDKAAVTESAVRGHELFVGKARCAGCHPPPLYTDDAVHDTGLGAKVAPVARPTTFVAGADGRFRGGTTAKSSARTSAVSTPSLRSLATTGPYGHDGAEKSLDAMIKYMVDGGRLVLAGYYLGSTCRTGICPDYRRDPALDKQFTKVSLTDDERADLAAFIRALEGQAARASIPRVP